MVIVHSSLFACVVVVLSMCIVMIPPFIVIYSVCCIVLIAIILCSKTEFQTTIHRYTQMHVVPLVSGL